MNRQADEGKVISYEQGGVVKMCSQPSDALLMLNFQNISR
ncbi:Uncharacterized protein dnm_039350 [Desulfonema magnum]|uniref:Uncharacterized protein n=1 Tax=Desulfonema magnum TaxID=45655 RepID=A0A975BN03_9BACT|nr:Uncharacterized protein dnm_039350 [Desulfonema magnum]